MRIRVEERHIKPEKLKEFQEIFLTGTAWKITAVGEIDGLRFTVGPVTKRLQEAYKALVRQRPQKKVKTG
nr:hypothetical protein [Alphaproteobacteria bacterium]